MARFWEFAQLSDNFKGISYFDQVPRAGQLYIGGLSAFHQEPDPLARAGITHVLTVLDYDLADTRPVSAYVAQQRHLWIQADDFPQEDLLRHFRRTSEFIDGALRSASSASSSTSSSAAVEGAGDGGTGGVFVHCAMGVSRSATLVCAYLMWKSGVEAREALEWLREGRKRCQPNPGFSRQLEVWGTMLKAKGGPGGQEATELYDRWVRSRYPSKV